MNSKRIGQYSNGSGGGGHRRGRGPGRPMVGPVEKAKDFKGTLLRLLRYLKPRRYQLLAVFSAAFLSTLFNMISPLLTGAAITSLYNDVMGRAGVNFDYIREILMLLIGLYIFSALFSYLQNYIMASVAQLTVYGLRKEANEKLARLPLKFYDARTHGEILSRVVNDLDNIGSTLQQTLTQLVVSLITFIGVIIMMLTINPLLTMLVVLILPLSFIVTKAITSRSQTFFIGQQKALGELNGHVEEMYTGHLVVKAFGYEDESQSRFEAINDRLYQSSWRSLFISGIIMPLMGFINNIGYVLICVVGGLLVTRQAIQIGDIQAFIQYARQFSQPITQAANIANIIQSTIASAERIFELLDEPEQMPEPAAAKEIKSPRGEVKFTGVRFGYTPGATLMENLDIHVQPGQTVAIVGPTGAGKTTLVNLLMRFYELDGGQITIDGVDIAQLTRTNLRNMFSMVLQDTWLFNGTIRENIAYGREGASDKDIIQAAQAAGADHFIRTLPDGYDTVLNEETSNLSQGQRQLLSIARAILADPDILILDEATSSVDTRTELSMQKAMLELRRSRTSFVIAHRLSTIRNADLILVMEQGRVVEQGQHAELMNRGGLYAELYNSQFAEVKKIVG